jgi:dienelactone hydrolase
MWICVDEHTMRTPYLVATLIAASAVISSAWDVTSQPTSDLSMTHPTVTASDAPAGTEGLAVRWFKVAAPELGVMTMAVARPHHDRPVPAVVLLHGTHGFAREYVMWAEELARAGFLAVAGCWFSGGGQAGAKAVTPPLPCPGVPPLEPGEYPRGLRYVDALVQAARTLPGVRPDRLALAGHSRGGGVALQYLLARGRVQAAVLHSSGYAIRPAARAAEFEVPLLLLHGTADGPADGGSANTQIALARDFETALRRNGKAVEARYHDGGGHNTFFTNASQHDAELKAMLDFLRRHLGP